MRRILLLTLCIPLLFSSCKKENEDINNNPSNTSILVGYGINNSEIFKTTNGGSSWNKMAFKNLETLDIINEDIVYGTFNNTIYKTWNGGSTWSEIFGGYKKVDFVSDSIGFGIFNGAIQDPNSGEWYNGNVICKTYNGGANWWFRAALFNTFGIYLNYIKDLCFVSENVGYCTSYDPWNNPNGDRYLFKTNDGGLTWNIIDQKFIENLDFVSEEIGYCYWDAFLYKTIDGGLTWEVKDEIPLNCFDFVSENIGYASNNWATFKTIDGGLTWDTVSTMSFNPISFILE